MDFPLRTKVEKTVSAVEKHWLSSNGKVMGAAISKKNVILIVFLTMKWLIIIDFFENSASVNNVSYCQILKQYFTSFKKWPLYIYIYVCVCVCERERERERGRERERERECCLCVKSN